MISDKLFAEETPEGAKKVSEQNSGSFSSQGSFQSFGSMGLDEEIVVMNPCDLAIDFNPYLEDDIIREEAKEDIESSNKKCTQLNQHVQKQLLLGFRDKKQKKRIDALKKKGIYKSTNPNKYASN